MLNNDYSSVRIADMFISPGFPTHLEKKVQTCKTGVGGLAKTWKDIAKPGQFDLTLKKLKSINQKKHLKKKEEKYPTQAKGIRILFYLFSYLFFGQRFGNCWFLLELQKCSSD